MTTLNHESELYWTAIDYLASDESDFQIFMSLPNEEENIKVVQKHPSYEHILLRIYFYLIGCMPESLFRLRKDGNLVLDQVNYAMYQTHLLKVIESDEEVEPAEPIGKSGPRGKGKAVASHKQVNPDKWERLTTAIEDQGKF
ncbi:hypothetical protein YC2023_040124 [Brassica napus]